LALGLVMLGLRTIAMALFVLMTAASAEAGLLSELGELAASSGKVGKLAGEVPVGLEDAARLVAQLPEAARKGAVAAEYLDGGAWRFRNAAGETITATGPEGIRGALSGLAPDAIKSGDKLSFYLSEESAYVGGVALDAFPEGSKLHVIVGDEAYPLLFAGKGEAVRLYAELSDTVIVSILHPQLFGEAMWQLKRPLGKSGIRIASLDQGGPSLLPTVGKRTAEGMPQAEAVDAAAFGKALSAIRGQTLIVTGDLEGDALKFTGMSGNAGSVPIASLMEAARSQDVNLLLLDAGTPKQPGTTTWLWQERGVAHLDKAMAEASLGDFIMALSRGQGRMEIATETIDNWHFRLTASPVAADAPAASGEAAGRSVASQITDVSGELAIKLAGHVVPRAAAATLNIRDTQTDIDSRLIPGLPAWVPWWYGASWAMGLIGFAQARRWWRILTRTRAKPPAMPWRIGYETAYWLLFTPLSGPWAFLAVMAMSIIGQFVGVWRLIAWPFRRRQMRA